MPEAGLLSMQLGEIFDAIGMITAPVIWSVIVIWLIIENRRIEKK